MVLLDVSIEKDSKNAALEIEIERKNFTKAAQLAASLNLNNNNELQFAAANGAWLERWYNWLLPQANAASSKSNKKEPSGKTIKTYYQYALTIIIQYYANNNDII